MQDDKMTWDEFKRKVDRSVRGTDVLFFVSWVSPYGLFVRRGPQGVTITDEESDFSTNNDHTNRPTPEELAKKLERVEQCIAWAAQTGYCFAEQAAAELGKLTGREMYCDQPYYNAHSWRDADKTEDQLEEDMEGEHWDRKRTGGDA